MKIIEKLALATVTATLFCHVLAAADSVADRLHAARTVVTEMLAASDKGVPEDLLQKSQCIVVVPGLKKAGFIVGGQYGKGFVVCKEASHKYSAPGCVRIEGGSVGFQIGADETDLILLIMNEGGVQHLLKSKFQIGGEATAAAGPVGRDVSARTDATMHAEILTYSRSRGLFAGISLQGSTLRQDLDDNRALFGKSVTNADVINGKVPPPADAAAFRATLAKYGF